jgi:hypothetical protein
MERSEIEAIRSQIEHSRRAAESDKTAGPFGIMLIAGIQFLKAAGLLLAATLLRVKPEMVNGPSSPIYPLLYVVTRGKLDSMNAALQGGNALPSLLFLLGIYLGAIGVGMLYVNAWARRTLIFSCGLTLVLFAKSSLWPDPAAPASPDMTNIYLLLAVDALVVFYLLLGSTAEFFQDSKMG